jgi:hypothetical protein
MEANKPNFFSHVFNFEDESRHDMMNIAQYSVLAVILVILLNKLLDTYMPPPDANKGTVMLAVEIMLQVIVMFLGVLFLHRIIEFIPTMSGVKYAPLNVITVILPLLVILLNVNSSSGIGQKVSMLWDSVTGAAAPKEKPTMKASQPGFNIPQFLPQGMNTGNPMQQQQAPTPVREPDFNTMFSSPNQPSSQEFEPMPANSVGGMSMFN